MPRVRRPVRFRQFSEFDRGRIMGLREAGLSFREVAVIVQRSVDTVEPVPVEPWKEVIDATKSSACPQRNLKGLGPVIGKLW
ncbi:unnamed protein product [Diabrotica balteata]|uniref:Transposase IS30-like HTH domain-containing protein n=1 Tax=Diabrotica balteata TaxID=107213 RepID=A0A9N9SM54_DIABA|nr:unnamed protein product [Diabrotica balteata]